jgi:hypothetical protein
MISLDIHAMRIDTVNMISGVTREEESCFPRRKSTFKW